MNPNFVESIESIAPGLSCIILIAIFTLILLIIIRILPYSLSDKQKKYLKKLAGKSL